MRKSRFSHLSRSAIAVSLAALLLAGGVIIGRALQDASKEEQAVRKAAFAYYSSIILGDTAECLKAARTPLVRVRDGKASLLDTDALRRLVADVGKRASVSNLPQETRQRVVGNMLRVFDEADIRFIGAATASVVFLVRPAARKGEGDWLGELVLGHTADGWRVVAEISDSKPAPPMLDVPEAPSG